MSNLSNLTDEQLALRYVGGDNGAFDELLARNKSILFTYILFMTGNYEVANDVFQDTFLKVIVRLQEGRYQEKGKFRHWLTSIAHNIIIDRFRNSGRISVTNIDETKGKENRLGLVDSGRENEIVNCQMEDDIRRLVSMLPTSQKEVVYLRFYRDMSFREIAQVTNVSINTALGRMRYAIINLRKMAKGRDVLSKLA